MNRLSKFFQKMRSNISEALPDILMFIMGILAFIAAAFVAVYLTVLIVAMIRGEIAIADLL